MSLPSMDLFIQVKSYPVAALVEMCEHIRTSHKTPGPGYIGGVTIEIIGDFDGNLATPQLDALAPYLPGGSKQTFDHLFVGSAIPEWTSTTTSPYREGIKDWQEREKALALQRGLWQKFAQRYPQLLPRFDVGLYINYEAVLEWWVTDPETRWSFEYYFRRSLVDAESLKPGVEVMWCPAMWVNKPPAGMRSAINTTWNNMKLETGRIIDRVDIEDMMGRNWINMTTTDVRDWYRLFSDTTALVTIDAELFEEPNYAPSDKAELQSRLETYIALGLPIGHCFEARYWMNAHDDAEITPPPTVPLPPTEILEAMLARAYELGYELEPID